MKRCPDAAFDTSPFKSWESKSAKLGAWGEQAGPVVRAELLKPELWVAAAAGERTSFNLLHSNQTQLVLLHYTQPGGRISSQTSNLSLAVRLPHSWPFS